MKKSNIQKKKLTKSELKEINGGVLPLCLRGFCYIPETGEFERGLVAKDGSCC
ncbi:class IIb bacteriocin, lactobin A/cerein 7B family [Chryseobacterium tructae]|uniref:Class IIb bacteriocin, lactobin A/cerein 7B family n=1 Tax=Chryseobacterium tructae TaxID=1037380 RepID=A0ABV7XQL7_9FLAO|nr:class IIb bacteriocin, lactobin A/cerein 7B family [Chryseobacterium tructae]MDN3695486.1 class IIb bacteriocin, lactobin A/cerein 7B family [Chryseobacterium tructae]